MSTEGSYQKAGREMVTSKMENGRKLRLQIARHIQEHDGENKDRGIGLDTDTTQQ